MEGQNFSRRVEGNDPFLLVVITAPAFFPGEAACLEGLLAAGLEKLHLRKPGASQEEMEALLQQIAPRWRSRLVLHHHSGSAGSSRELVRLAARYGIPQIHRSLKEVGAGEPDAVEPEAAEPDPEAPGPEAPIAVSASLHSWSAMKEIEGRGLTYVFMSPVFDSISKPGYPASPGLLHRPAGPYPCKVKVIGLGGVDKDTLVELLREGWEGAAVLGYIWEDPDDAVKRYEQLKKMITHHCP
ncbi:MAG TPA: thiamine phosphate synthase [Puia sp.]